MPAPTLLDIAKLNGSDDVVGLIDEAGRPHPEISGMIRGFKIPNLGAARTIKGTQYKTLVRTGLPTAGFRNANEGIAPSKSSHENRLVETFILNPRWECDKAVADSYEDGPETYISLEAAAVLEAGLTTLCKQFYYGRNSGGDAKGHPGLQDSVDSSMIIDATGSTASTGSSVWLIRFGVQQVQWVYGEKGQLMVSDVRQESVLDSGGTNKYTAYIQELLAYPGVQVGSKYSCARIKNLTAQTGKTLTDSLIYDALAAFPAGTVPDVILMSRRSAKQLRASRTATNATGVSAPLPTEVEGIPIGITESILDTETIA